MPLASCNATFLEYNKEANHPSLTHGLHDSQLCALDSTTCQGDGGGPIFTYHSESGVSTLVGVTSWGVGCGPHLPSVYTRIASYVDWIESVVWLK